MKYVSHEKTPWNWTRVLELKVVSMWRPMCEDSSSKGTMLLDTRYVYDIGTCYMPPNFNYYWSIIIFFIFLFFCLNLYIWSGEYLFLIYVLLFFSRFWLYLCLWIRFPSLCIYNHNMINFDTPFFFWCMCEEDNSI